MQYPSQLIDGKESRKFGTPGNPWRQPVDHPTVLHVSWCEEPYDIGSVEAAFFDHNGEWHSDIVRGFEEYEDGCESYRAYRHIPREFLIE